MDYKSKYQLYKNKYLRSKNQQKGGVQSQAELDKLLILL